jgi:peroxiredoxin
MRKLRPVSLLLVGVVACSTQHSADHDGPAVAPPTASPGALAGAAPTAPGGAPQLAPPLRGTLADGKSFEFQKLRGDRVVLIFYRSAFCGLCAQQLRLVADDKELYKKLDAKIVAITADPPDLIDRTANHLDLDYPIVSVDRATLTRWGVWPDGARTPRPAVFIIAENGTIRFRQIGQTAADRVSDATIAFTLRAIDARRDAE